MILSAVLVLIGLVLLTGGADRAVDAAEAVADQLGISPLVVGALLVGLGTSLPEMVVSGIAAGTRDDVDLAVGNVVGSNIANLTLVLGVGALIHVIGKPRPILQSEGVLVLAATALFAGFAFDDHLARWEGVVLLVAMVAAAALLARSSSSEPGVDLGVSPAESSAGRALLVSGISMAAVVAGAWLLVAGAVDIADELGASEGFIGLTLVAIGTSLPELATSVSAARRGSTELIVGNVFGSNIFNSLAVGGVAAVVGSGTVSESATVSLLGMSIITVAVLATGWLRGAIHRSSAVVLLVAYVVVLIVSR